MTAKITRTPGIMSGDPCVHGTRVFAETVLAEIRSGDDEATIRDWHPTLPKRVVKAVLTWSNSPEGSAWLRGDPQT